MARIIAMLVTGAGLAALMPVSAAVADTGTVTDLGTLGGTYSGGNAISSNGTTVAGYAATSASTYHAFLWTQAGGMVDLGTLGGSYSSGYAISSNGTTVAGSAYTSAGTYHAFLWTQAGGMVDLGTLGGGTRSSGSAISSNGTTVAGYAYTSGGAQHAFLWTQAGGMQDLNTLLSGAGVNMTGITLNKAAGLSSTGQYITGTGAFPGFSQEAYLACYSPSNGCVGVTTASNQAASVQNLAADQRAVVIESRSTANELLGMTRPVDDRDYYYVGGMFGSAVGYTGGQYSANGVTVLGGVAYGRQDYPNIRAGNATTAALAARYTFAAPFDNDSAAIPFTTTWSLYWPRTLHPFAEFGSWLTPRGTLTLSRPYANGAGTDTGTGTTNATSWAEYIRIGLIQDATPHDRITGYGELGQQFMRFDAYTENTAGNPFPASVNSGLFHMDVARVGGSWTHTLPSILQEPDSLTVAGAVARSFDVHSGLTATVPGVGLVTASNMSDTWGEFGARFETRFTPALALDLDLNGTTGAAAIGTAVHEGVSLSYRF